MQIVPETTKLGEEQKNPHLLYEVWNYIIARLKHLTQNEKGNFVL